MSKNVKKIVLVGGGTGGHAGPIFALFQELKKFAGIDIVVVGTGTEEERLFFRAISPVKIIKSGKLNRYLTLKNIAEGCKFLIGFFQSVFFLMSFRPNIIFSKGGYTSLPIILAAKFLGIPFFIHESDIEMGKVNQLMARWARTAFVAYPVDLYDKLKLKNIEFSGPILRQGFQKQAFLNSKTILLTGGSQGSRNMTEHFLPIAKELLADYKIIHQAGKHGIELAKDFALTLTERERGNYVLREMFMVNSELDQMLEAEKESALIITRAGSTILELAVLGKPMVLIPWQHSAQDHQQKNADYFTQHQAAVSIKEQGLTADKLKNLILSLLNDEDERKKLSEHAKSLVPVDGREQIVAKILNFLELK